MTTRFFTLLLLLFFNISFNYAQGLFLEHNNYYSGNSTSNNIQLKDGNYYTFTDLKSCKGINLTTGDPVDITSTFSPDDSVAFIWIHLTNIYRAIRFKVVFNPPFTESGEYIGDWYKDPRDDGYDYWTYIKEFAFIRIKGYPSSFPEHLGDWTVDIYVEEDNSGVWNYEESVDLSITESSASTNLEVPENNDQILSIFPNPTFQDATISYKIDNNSLVRLDVFDLNGRFVENLENDYKSAGNYSINWNPEHIDKGVYNCRLMISNNDEIIMKNEIMLLR